MSTTFDWTDEQKAIFEPLKWGHAVISACAGSGKSTTVVERALRDIERAQPWQSIALISFTNKSAQDLRQKLSNQNAQSRIIVSTFHAFLKSHVLRFDDVFRGKELPFTYQNKQPNLKAWLDYFSQTGQVAFATNSKQDFLFEHSLSLIRSQPNLKKYLQAKFHAVYIDEAQDNNGLQYEIVDELMALGIECVLIGDPDQTIYGFRGAEPQKFRNLENDERFINAGGVLRMSTNHRCHAKINHWAQQSILPSQNDYEQINESQTRHGVFICRSESFRDWSQHELFKKEGCAVLVHSLNNQLNKLPTHIKTIKPPPLVEQADNPARLSNLYRLALLGNRFNAYHFIDAECTDDERNRSLTQCLKEFNCKPTLANLQTLNQRMSVLPKNLEQAFIESLNDPLVTGFFTHNPLHDQIAMTIHSAKGLEFNNVFVYASDFTNLSNSDTKQLHYVAFTRAIKRLICLQN